MEGLLDMTLIEQLTALTPVGVVALLLIVVLKGMDIYGHKVKTEMDKRKVNGEMGQVIRAIDKTGENIGRLTDSLNTYVSEDRQSHTELNRALGGIDKTVSRILDKVNFPQGR